MTGVSKYLKSWSLGLKAGLEYRANFFFSIAAAAAPVVIQTALWIALYGGARQEELFGFTFPQMVAYTVIAHVITSYSIHYMQLYDICTCLLCIIDNL